MTQPAISRQVTGLEERLGTRLVHRTTQAVTLTEEGRQLLGRARELIDGADLLLDWAAQSRGRPVGQVRIAVPVPLGLYLGTHIDRLLDGHPEMSIDLVLRDVYGNLVEEGLDAEIRVGESADTSLISRRIGSTNCVLVASPDYLASRNPPSHPNELGQHDCIVHQRGAGDEVWWFTDPATGDQDDIAVAVTGRFSSNNAAAIYRAAMAGHGIASVSILLALDDLAKGRLIRLLPHHPCRRDPIYIDYPSRRHLPMRVRVVIDFIADLMKELMFSEDGQEVDVRRITG